MGQDEELLNALELRGQRCDQLLVQVTQGRLRGATLEFDAAHSTAGGERSCAQLESNGIHAFAQDRSRFRQSVQRSPPLAQREGQHTVLGDEELEQQRPAS